MQSIKAIVKPLTSVGKVSVLDISWVLATYLDNFDCKMYPETWCSTAKFTKSQKRVGVIHKKNLVKGSVHTTVEAARMVKQNIREAIDKSCRGKCRKARNIK